MPRGKSNKRKKSQDSPESVVSKSQHKRRAKTAKTSKKVNKNKETMSEANPTFTQSPQQQSQSLLPQCPPQVPPYPGPGPHGPYYTPPSQYSSQTQFNTQSQVPNSPQQPNFNFQQIVLDKLFNMEQRLNTLDSIDSKLSNLTQKMTIMANRVSSLESKVNGNYRKLNDIEASRAHDSQTCDEIQNKQVTIDKQLRDERLRASKLEKDLERVQHSNSVLSDDIVDLQARSMRDNLLFFGFDEATTFDARRDENCVDSVLDFCENVLNLPNVRETLKIDRAHRIGLFKHDKQRPIVAKFNFYQDKLVVKRSAFETLDRSTSKFRVSDQFPKVIQDRRKSLIPALIRAKNENKKAVLSYDKLYINNKLYKPESESSVAME